MVGAGRVALEGSDVSVIHWCWAEMGTGGGAGNSAGCTGRLREGGRICGNTCMAAIHLFAALRLHVKKREKQGILLFILYLGKLRSDARGRIKSWRGQGHRGQGS